MDELGKKIEETYNELLLAIKKINVLSETIDGLKTTTTEIINQYTQTIDQSKLEKTRASSEKALNAMLNDIRKVEEQMSGFEVIKQTLEDSFELFTKRMASLEDNIKKTKGPIQEIDQKLIKYIKEAEKNNLIGLKRLTQAATLVDAKEEIQKYDKLLELEKENNKLLKQLLAKESVKPIISKEENFKLNGGKPKADNILKNDSKLINL
jgi:hypothetical protein